MNNIKGRLEKLERKFSLRNDLVPDYGMDYFYGDQTAVRYLPATEYAKRVANKTLDDFYRWVNDPTPTRFFTDHH